MEPRGPARGVHSKPGSVPSGNQQPALLKGLLFGPDGAAFLPTHTRKGDRLYRYYFSHTVLKHGAGACLVGRVQGRSRLP